MVLAGTVGATVAADVRTADRAVTVDPGMIAAQGVKDVAIATVAPAAIGGRAAKAQRPSSPRRS